MHRTLAIVVFLCMATSVSFAASKPTLQGTDLEKPSLSLRTAPVFHHPAEFSLKTDPSLGSLRTSPFQPEYNPMVRYDFDEWFKSNAPTIAIIALAVLLLIIIAD